MISHFLQALILLLAVTVVAGCLSNPTPHPGEADVWSGADGFLGEPDGVRGPDPREELDDVDVDDGFYDPSAGLSDGVDGDAVEGGEDGEGCGPDASEEADRDEAEADGGGPCPPAVDPAAADGPGDASERPRGATGDDELEAR